MTIKTDTDEWSHDAALKYISEYLNPMLNIKINTIIPSNIFFFIFYSNGCHSWCNSC